MGRTPIQTRAPLSARPPLAADAAVAGHQHDRDPPLGDAAIREPATACHVAPLALGAPLLLRAAGPVENHSVLRDFGDAWGGRVWAAGTQTTERLPDGASLGTLAAREARC